MTRLVVQKFGSSVLPSEDALPVAVDEIYRAIRSGNRVVAVVSAFGDTTDELIEKAGRFGRDLNDQAYADLISTGETTSAALLVLALERAGIPATLFDAGRAGLRTAGAIVDATPIELDAAALRKSLRLRPVVVMPGFLGRDSAGGTTLLGRGGSDLTALFVARQLGAARCVLFKDVDGLYDSDPAASDADPQRYDTASWKTAYTVGGPVIQSKAVAYAWEHGLEFVLKAPNGSVESRIGELPDQLVSPVENPPVKRVVLLGLGTVGLGVYRRLRDCPDRFVVVSVAIRDRAKHRHSGVPLDLLTDDPWEALSQPHDIVIEAIGGATPATDLIEQSLAAGKHVVTANKEVIARSGSRLRTVASISGARLRYAAAVGGSAPFLEAVERVSSADEVESVSGVLNGTTNFILDRLAAGYDFEMALDEAQKQGFAEADPTDDLDGTDASRKLAIIIRTAFGVDVDPDTIPCTGIRGITTDAAQQALSDGKVIRLVATCARRDERVSASVRPVIMERDDPMARITEEANIIAVRSRGGLVETITGKGAGRWPTAQAVLADVFDVGDVYRGRTAAADNLEYAQGGLP